MRLITKLFIVLFIFATSAWATSPPWDNVSYRGDVNGDFLASLPDVVAVRDLTSLKAVDCSGIIPSNADKCDSADMNGDSVVTLADVTVFRDLTSLKDYATPDLPWSLDISGIPTSVTGSAPIQVAITNISGVGRPGIVVRFSVAATAEATLSGRKYNPADDGVRDHASPPGAKKVLVVTHTNFPSDQSGATEQIIPNVGTQVEITCTSSGTVTLNIDVLGNAFKGVPALSASPNINCLPIPECMDGTDNDGDTFVDYYLDLGCASFWDTSEIDGNICSDGVDNDGDTFVDFPADPGCSSLSDTDELGTNECNDTIDNDGDTYADYPLDPGCSTASDISEYGANECDDGFDNDGDTFPDWINDPGCFNVTDPSEYGTNDCDDGADNDGDTTTDYPDDPGCVDVIDTSEYLGTDCDDGLDNDGDTATDYQIDPGCADINDIDELGTNECDDGIDNDGDTLTDLVDTMCAGNPGGLTETGECQDSIDNDADTVADFPADPACTASSDLSEVGTNECDDDLDNDGDTVEDIEDPGCYNNPAGITESSACQDGVDNDGDTVIDFPLDPGCDDVTDNSETGNWIELVGSASVGGVSNNGGNSIFPELFLDSSGYPVIAWADNTSGNYEIYIKRWNGSAWVEIGTGSASGGGISNNAGDSVNSGISLFLDSNDYPVVAWDDNTNGNWEIYIKRWNGSAWVEIGAGSAIGVGISNGTQCYGPSIWLDSDDNPIVAWAQGPIGVRTEIFVKRWNGSAWVELGGSASPGGISNNPGNSARPSVGLDSFGNPIVAWTDDNPGPGTNEYDIYLRAWNGVDTWAELAGSASGGGISNLPGNSAPASLFVDSSDNPVLAWYDENTSNWEIYVRRWNGVDTWVEVGAGSASGGGISNNAGNSDSASLFLDSNDYPVVAWGDNTNGNHEIYIKQWNGSAWEEKYPGSASGGGVSNNGGYSGFPSLFLDSAGNSAIAWQDDTSGNSEIYFKMEAVAFECSDGFDNDGDTFTDFPNDPGCTDTYDNEEFELPGNITFNVNYIGVDGTSIYVYVVPPGSDPYTEAISLGSGLLAGNTASIIPVPGVIDGSYQAYALVDTDSSGGPTSGDAEAGPQVLSVVGGIGFITFNDVDFSIVP